MNCPYVRKYLVSSANVPSPITVLRLTLHNHFQTVQIYISFISDISVVFIFLRYTVNITDLQTNVLPAYGCYNRKLQQKYRKYNTCAVLPNEGVGMHILLQHNEMPQLNIYTYRLCI